MSVLGCSVRELHGVGDAKVKAFEKLGIHTIGDLLDHHPRAYQNRGDVTTVAKAANHIRETGEIVPVSLILTVANDAVTARVRGRLEITKFRAFDESGVAEIVFFNQSYLRDTFRRGATFRFWCTPTYDHKILKLNTPAFEPVIPGRELDAIVPVYPLTKGLSQKLMNSFMREALKISSMSLTDHIPSDVIRENGLATLSYATRNIHFPENLDGLLAARKRFDFDRAFCASLALASRKMRSLCAAPPMKNTDFTAVTDALPYPLTGAQARAAAEIAADMSKPTQMARILCGDVGSGKTAVAAISAYIAVSNGYQCALMVPTEILARQHYNELSRLFDELGYRSALLTGSLTPKEKKEMQASLSEPDGPMLVIGTHALLSDNVKFRNLGLVITDEQHRFGAAQRAALKEKSESAHTLVMSATPIPRTLALVYYGDLSRSVLDELPPGRQKVSTFAVDESYRDRLEGFICKQAAEGHRTYIVCPAIEEISTSGAGDDADNAYNLIFDEPAEKEPPIKNAVDYAERLKEKLPQLKIGLMHGKMKAQEKDRVMTAFAEGDLDVLVSTTVIEVGVNVPEATLMVIENAERFGLSQLHQLRGRVGRGKDKSWCILVSDTRVETSRRRLEIMCTTRDGYVIAEEDLKLRGPGDFFANGGIIRQSGSASLPTSAGEGGALYESAVNSAKALIDKDPELTGHPELRRIVSRLVSGTENTIN